MKQRSWFSEMSQETGISDPQQTLGTLAMGDLIKGSKRVFVSTSPLPLCEAKREVITVEVLSYSRESMMTLPYLTLPYLTLLT